MSDLHRAAAEGFGRGAEIYARGRPDFPRQALDWLQDDLKIGGDQRVLELGAGTGKFTQLLMQTGAGIVAVEPVAAMLQQLVDHLPRVRAVRALTQNLPFARASMDAVICAQSFHWFATTDASACRTQRMPGGRRPSERCPPVKLVARGPTSIPGPPEVSAGRHHAGSS